MKKLISVLLIIGMLASFAAGCSSEEEPLPISVDPVATTAPIATSSPTEPDSIATDENLLTVDITLPASIFESEDMSTFDFDSYASEQKFISAELNADGSVTVKMTKSRHNELLEEMSKETDVTFAELIEGADTPYIKNITHNGNFSEITIEVIRADYENVFDFTPFTVGMSAMLYQMFLDMEYHVEVTVQDVENGDVINTFVYPDDLG